VKGFHDEQQQASRKKEFAIGVSEIDAQHQELFSRLDRLRMEGSTLADLQSGDLPDVVSY